jgi:hypothetical protein
MTDEIMWETTGGKLDDIVSPPIALSEGVALILGGADWVRTPETLGSRKLYILRRTTVDRCCPQCQAPGPHQLAVLQQGMGVLGCESCQQYIWVSPRRES